jgi:hypothetical protein
MNIIVLDQFCIAQRKLLLRYTDVQYGLSFQQSLCAGLIIFSNDRRPANADVTELAFMPLEQNQNHAINYFHTFTRRSCKSSGEWCHVDWEIVADVSEELTLSIGMFCEFLDCMSQKTWSYLNDTVRTFKFMLAFELSRFWTLDLFTYMFLVILYRSFRSH